jgi:dienelactone hydrolase
MVVDIVWRDRAEAARGHINVKGGFFPWWLGRDASRPTEPITTKVLICHGANDPYVSKEEITAFQQEMRDTNGQMIYYANAVHGFTIQNMEMTIQGVLTMKSCQTLF